VRRRYALIVSAALTVGVLTGWGVGSGSDTCEYTCPPGGAPCPEPPDCRIHHFHWLGAFVVGLLVAVVIVTVAIAVVRRTDDV